MVSISSQLIDINEGKLSTADQVWVASCHTTKTHKIESAKERYELSIYSQNR